MATKPDKGKRSTTPSSTNSELNSKKAPAKAKKQEEDDDIEDDDELNVSTPKKTAMKAFKGTTKPDEKDESDADDDWNKSEEEDEWDPDFEEFDLPKSRKTAKAGKEADAEDFIFDEDEELKQLLNDGGFEDDEDDL
ncbi:MAG: hypothetical protein ABR502_07970 [Chitinophagaceae bacterium]